MKQPKKLTRNQKEYISKIKPKLDLQNYRLVKEDPNGYVEVITDLGNAYIKAYKLREEVEEEVIKENKEQPKATNKEIWEAFKEGFFRD